MQTMKFKERETAFNKKSHNRVKRKENGTQTRACEAIAIDNIYIARSQLNQYSHMSA